MTVTIPIAPALLFMTAIPLFCLTACCYHLFRLNDFDSQFLAIFVIPGSGNLFINKGYNEHTNKAFVAL